jgi:hypothetical protein
MFKIINKIKFQTIPWGSLAVILITLIFSVPFTLFFIWTFLLMHLFIGLLGDREIKSIFNFKNPWLIAIAYIGVMMLIILLGFAFAYIHNFLVRVVPFGWKQFDNIIFWMIFGLWIAVSSMRKIFNISREKTATILTTIPVMICLGLFVMGSINESPKKMVQQLHGITILNHLKRGFYFEKYDTENEAKEALLKMYPVGSNAEGLIKTIERAGGEKYEPKISEEYINNPELAYVVHYRYTDNTLDCFFPKHWSLSIEYDESYNVVLLGIQIVQGE